MRCSEQIFTHGGAMAPLTPKLPFLAGGRNPFLSLSCHRSSRHRVNTTRARNKQSLKPPFSIFGGNTDVKAKVESPESVNNVGDTIEHASDRKIWQSCIRHYDGHGLSSRIRLRRLSFFLLAISLSLSLQNPQIRAEPIKYSRGSRRRSVLLNQNESHRGMLH